MAARTPTCLSCLRRITAPSTTTLPGFSSLLVSGQQQQVRYKSKKCYDQGVIVRLLEDVPKYGRKDAIFRVERGRMRNLWYPTKKAEYMTSSRFQELGLSRGKDIGERDPMFRAYDNGAEDAEDVEQQAGEEDSTLPAFGLAPERIHTLLSTLLPHSLTFHRKPIHVSPTPAPEPVEEFKLPSNKRSPLLALHDAEEETFPPPLGQTPEVDTTAIFGSVSTADVLAAIKGYLANDTEAVRIPLDVKGIHILTSDGADRVKNLGEWEVEIAVPGAGEELPEVRFVNRRLVVLPVEETE